jgi:DNA-directed RNA polymerase subunit RPC12/RpoP
MAPRVSACREGILSTNYKKRCEALETLIQESAPLTWVARGDMEAATAWEKRAQALLAGKTDEKPELLCIRCGKPDEDDIHMDGTNGPDDAHMPVFRCKTCGHEYEWSDAVGPETGCPKCTVKNEA